MYLDLKKIYKSVFANMLMIRCFTLATIALRTTFRLQDDVLLAIRYFRNDYMKLNEDKCHLLVSGRRYETTWAKIS